jgi:uncharacterized membrane protein YagU involved in acid resistance
MAAFNLFQLRLDLLIFGPLWNQNYAKLNAPRNEFIIHFLAIISASFKVVFAVLEALFRHRKLWNSESYYLIFEEIMAHLRLVLK